MNETIVVAAVLAALFSLATAASIVAVVMFFRSKERAQAALLAEKERFFSKSVETLREQFSNLAAQALRTQSGDMAKRSQEQLDAVLRPLRDQVVQLQMAAKKAEIDRENLRKRISEDVGAIGGIATELAKTATALKTNTRVQGRSGEDILAEKLRQAGLEENVSFFLQDGTDRDRPDAQVCDAENRWLVIDSKVSLTAYLEYAEAKDDDARKAKLAAHVASVRQKIDQLARKKYPVALGEEFPERNYLPVTAMFVPYEAPLMEALKADASLWQFAAQNNVVLVSPLTLLAYLRLVYLAWQREKEARNQREIVNAARELLTRMNGFLMAFESVGRGISSLQATYDEAKGVIVDAPRAQTIAKAANRLIDLHVRLESRKGRRLEKAECLNDIADSSSPAPETGDEDVQRNYNPHRGIAVVLCACAAAAGCLAARADCLDELMPRPRIVHRGSDDINATHVAHQGGYALAVRGGKPEIQADAEGRLYARATWAQLRKLAGAGSVPDCTIVDWPEFRYRGLMLDCGRNYQSVESIKDVISMLSAYKMNVFHWHLTDNYGWRLESKKHPELQRKEAFSRNVGKFYTQAEFKEVLAFAKKRGVTVIPELDMPGHTLAFRKATGIGDLADEKAKVVLGELIDELCSLAPSADMPIVHLGTDEARERGEKVPQSHLDYWAKKVTDNGRTLMGWSPGLRLPGQSIKQLWMGAKDPRGDKTPYIDSQNSYYINHVDPEELLSVAAYQQPCRWGESDEKLGAIIGVWHDDAIADTEDIVRMNAVYPAIVLLSDNFWRGREKDEPSLYARLPNPDDPRFALAADLERRTIAQRDKVLKGMRHPFPYVAQTQMRWRMTDEKGSVLGEDIPQATIYPRHFWFPASAYAPGNGGVVVLETWIESERDIDCGAWIGMTGFSRSDGRSRDAPTPKIGEWNKHGATIELNGRKIEPPKWAHPGVGGNPKETPLVDEDYWYRAPMPIHLKKGENYVKMTLPKKGGWKWIGSFTPVLGTSDHPREVPGLSYGRARCP